MKAFLILEDGTVFEGKKIVTENAYYLASLTGEHADEH